MVLAAVMVAVLAVGSGVALARTRSSGPTYRLAAARVGDVEQDLVSVGTVSAAQRASVAFPVSGTVASVLATVGAKVGSGDILATLDTTALKQQVANAEAALATAKQTLATDEAGESGDSTTATLSAVTTSDAAVVPVVDAVLTAAVTATRPAPNGSSGRNPGTGTGVGGVAGKASARTAALTAAQHRVAQAQAALDRDLDAAESTLQACATDLAKASGGPTASATPTASASPSPSASASPSPSASASPGPSASAGPTGSGSAAGQARPTASPGPTTSGNPTGDPVADCLAAIGRAPSQARIGTDRAAVAAAQAGLNSAIAALTAAAGSTTGTGSTTGSPGRMGSGQQSGTKQSGSQQAGTKQSGNQQTGTKQAGNQQSGGRQTGRGSTGPASAEQLTADRAQIDAAAADLVLAQRNLSAAVLTSPISGTVAAVAIQRGQTVSANSGSITVVGGGREQVSTTVSLADVDSVKVGDPATVTVDGVAAPLPGRVSSIGLLNTTTGSSTSYPVTVLLDPTTAKLFDGSGASVTIRVATVKGVLTVPSSAVHTTGRLPTVTVIRNGKASTTGITVGAVGSDRTEVRSGLSAGDQVVLATLGTPLPSSDSTTNRRFISGFGGGGTFGGGTGRPGG
ncbi:MAG: efflux RND transporter periplasmic adaptor subunit [Actinobacteria bacterium]|nr:efflux RND transporter periplasmic adaptor subunit [Actinomycetota bacterium]